MIKSGRTRSVSEQLVKWYEKEYKNLDTEWIWGYNEKALQRLLETREPVPFRCFFIRYLLEIHKEELQDMFALETAGKDWVNECAEKLLGQIEAGQGETYKTASDELKLLTDMAYEDFQSNLGGLPAGKDTDQKKKRTWSRSQILSKITADHISTGELWILGFGLNMDCEDLSFFLKKALKREDFNLWNYQEFLLYLTFRYAQGNCFEFYEKLEEAFREADPIACDWSRTEGFSTTFIKNRADMMAEKIQENYFAFALNDEGELPDTILHFLGEYKYLIEYTEDYTRTVQKESARLLTEFKARIKDDVSESKKILKEDTPEIGRVSQGKVLVYYDPEKGLDIPRGTVFYKKDIYAKMGTVSYRDSENGEDSLGKTAFYGGADDIRIGFVAEKAVLIPPAEEAVRMVKIPVQCVKKTKKMRKTEKEYGYVPGNTEFSSNNPYLREIRNKSQFKTPIKSNGRKLEEGELTCVAGTLYAQCTAGKKIPRGTEFHPVSEGFEQITFVSKEDVTAEVYEEIWVYCQKPEYEATLNEIVDCSIPGWQSKFERIGNKKIGFNKKKAQDAAKGGVLYNYLYPAFDEFYDLKDGMDRKYLQKLGMVLEGTQLSSTKLSQIESQKADGISRNDILTLSFLEYMSEIEEDWKENCCESESEEDYRLRRAGFIERTNSVLTKCGFYELYAPNPYDSLLICLLSSNEGIEAYRNLWGWYLANK